jgi:hypothetical protein
MAVGDDAQAGGFPIVPETGEAGRIRWGALEINRTRDFVALVKNMVPVGKPAFRLASGITYGTNDPVGGSDGDIHFKVVGGLTVTYVKSAGIWVISGSASPTSSIIISNTPSKPAEGSVVTYFVSSSVVWPTELVWSTEPDNGVAPTITGNALVSLFTLNGITRAVMAATYDLAGTTTTTTTAAATTTTTTTAAATTTTTTTAAATTTTTTTAAASSLVNFVDSANTDHYPSGSTITTFSAVNIGNPDPGRHVILAIAYAQGGTAAPTVTIGGISATIDAWGGGATVGRVCIARAVVPNGTTADVVITYPAANYRAGMGVYVGNNIQVGAVGAIYPSATPAARVDITNPAGGLVVAGAISIGVTATVWNGATMDYLAEQDTVDLTSARTDTEGALSITAHNETVQYDVVHAVAYTAL